MLWNQKFAFGIDAIDKQHRELFRLMNRTNELMVDAEEGIDCYDEISEVLQELKAYTVYHFEDEERMLIQVGYPDFEKHSKEHTNFVNKVTEVLSSDIDFHQEGTLNDVYEFLLKWVSNHILYTDMKYVPLMKDKL